VMLILDLNFLKKITLLPEQENYVNILGKSTFYFIFSLYK